MKEGGAGKSEMNTVCVIKGLGQAATSLVPFGDVDEDGIQGAIHGEEAGPAWAWCYLKVCACKS